MIMCKIFIVILLVASEFVFLSAGVRADIEKENKNNWAPQLNKKRGDIYQSKPVITDIKSKEPFVDIKQEKIWNFESKDKMIEDNIPDLGWLNSFMQFVAMIVEAALWIFPVIIVFYLYHYRKHWLGIIQRSDEKDNEQPLPDTLFGLDMRRKNIPDNIAESAIALWENKKYRESVSLLYRGALIQLFRQYRFDLPAGATEQDCLRYIRQSEQNNRNDIVDNHEKNVNQNSSVAFFEYLTQVWVKVAYAHQIPDEKVFKRICDDWSYNFSGREL
ncbi:hypothetical protein MNBD_GAMMA09-2334 [hydrothermal vent metagenome]|uniref:DUF4129 domain-containing protein n=1 Tax=hydrothermal vent metagenome TaxID=652676 RepID=A0A3B0YGK9_9ZZZZ